VAVDNNLEFLLLTMIKN